MNNNIFFLMVCVIKSVAAYTVVEDKKALVSLNTTELSKNNLIETFKSKDKNISNLSFQNGRNLDLVVQLNYGVDLLLTVVRWAFVKKRELFVPISDIDKEFGHDFYIGTFHAKEGFLGDLGSLERKGDVLFVKHGSSVVLHVPLRLASLNAGYKNYTFTLLRTQQTGEMNITIDRASVTLQLTLTYSPGCSLALDYIRMDELSGIQVNSTGLGAYRGMFDLVTRWLTANFEDRFREAAERRLNQKMLKVTQDINKMLCAYFPQL